MPAAARARVVSKLGHDVGKLMKLLARIGRPEQLHLVYEAGPTGYGLQRALAQAGYACEVIAPSQMPRRAGDRVKTDGRDCVQLAECSRAGQLRAVWVPEPMDEAVRDVARAREDAVNSRTQARHQLKGFLLRHGLRFAGKTSWSKAYYAWLGSLSFEVQPAHTAFTEYWLAVQAADERVLRLTRALGDAVAGWRFEPVVKALQALGGVDIVTAASLVAEIGDLRRFGHPRKLMGYLGLVPSEASSGDRVRRGSITKTGNAHARRLLTEAAWHYRFKARIGTHAQPQAARAVAAGARDRLERAVAPAQEVCSPASTGRAGQQGMRGGCP